MTLEVGDKAPDFDVLLTDGSQVSLNDILSNDERVVLYFYPKDNTPGCTTQACDFRDNYSILQSAGYRVLGVSKDSSKSHLNFTDKYELNFDLIVDQDIELHQKYGVWREKNNYGKTYMGVSRSTFVIDTDGSLIWVGYNIRAKGHVEKLMRELSIE
ncbi:MAG TPA: thioredoxin-dependent thiol peroxidase [Candidatus Thalassarchaeaceae archaeon]|nr:MAG TPA: thioredoxin-dependent thiol peroxidase [Candidatus Poseidoniales archaeon]HIH79776.1 thioredoxin-dependent thiol peroxidase [Candidatus Thalassarchaeaceae archaeon]